MNVSGALFWGLIATLVQSTLEAGGQRVGFSRMSLPFLLGTIVTSRRERALLVGLGLHVVNGWAFSLVYAAILERTHRRAGWVIGGVSGLVHSLFVLNVIMDVLPALHPRMASEDHGPEPTRQLEPPGFLALNYGRGTPLLLTVSHVLYGVLFGAFYRSRR